LILPSRYYEENLYPLQDGVLNTLSRSDTDFFLTGGTALSRAYYNHRYSDDLDFFVNQSQTYDEQLDKILALLHDDGFVWDSNKKFIRDKNFSSMKVKYKNSDTLLKLDFVNDLVPHYGEITSTNLFYRTDSIRNILSNKLSAIFRYAAKDIADIREIALHETIDWKTIINEARQKEAGLEFIYISEILTGMPQSEFETITWTKNPDWKEFQNDINRIVYEMISGEVS
jgi:predicted nucleotidyltransferase component of viral defense system